MRLPFGISSGDSTSEAVSESGKLPAAKARTAPSMAAGVRPDAMIRNRVGSAGEGPIDNQESSPFRFASAAGAIPARSSGVPMAIRSDLPDVAASVAASARVMRGTE